MGEEGRAERFTHESLELAGRIGHAHTMAYALTYCAVGSQLRGDAQTTLVLAEQCLELSREHRFRLWLLWSSALRAWALAELGRPQEGLLVLRRVLEQWQQSGIQAGMPHNLGMLAHIHLKLGQAREGLEALEEALRLPEVTGERSYEPELHRLRGELLRLEGREEEAHGEFLEAIRLASQYGMHGYERRARAALARQLQASGEGVAPSHP